MSKMHKSAQIQVILFTFVCWSLTTNNIHANLSSLAKNDAFPMFSSLDPQTFLLTYEKLKYRDVEWADAKGKYASLSISPFAQNADKGKPIEGQTPIEGLCIEDTTKPCSDALGDLTGRSGMIPLIYGPLPEEINQWPSTLQTAREGLFPDQVMEDPNAILNDPMVIDPTQMFGYFSFPLKYRKRGVRFDIKLQFWDDIGVNIQTSVSSIRQTVQERKNLTTTDFMGLTADDVNTFLMKPLDNIAQEIDLDICNFQQKNETFIFDVLRAIYVRPYF